MLSETSVISALLFSAACYPLISFQFRDTIKSKKAALFWSIAIVCVFISLNQTLSYGWVHNWLISFPCLIIYYS
jgi:hypothetical protein